MKNRTINFTSPGFWKFGLEPYRLSAKRGTVTLEIPCYRPVPNVGWRVAHVDSIQMDLTAPGDLSIVRNALGQYRPRAVNRRDGTKLNPRLRHWQQPEPGLGRLHNFPGTPAAGAEVFSPESPTL